MLGLFNAESNFYPTFTSAIDRAAPIPGGIAIASQSGAYGSHIYMVSHQRGLGINYWITTGMKQTYRFRSHTIFG